MLEVSQPYDSTLKALFEGHAPEVLYHLIGAIYVDELPTEALKPSLRPDRVYLGWYQDVLVVLHLEMETASDSEIIYRMLEYFGILVRKYRKPIVSVILYPFRASVPKSPLRIMIGEECIAELHFRVIPLWEQDALYYIEHHVIGMYPLLPTMKNANYDRLAPALDELRQWYGENKWSLGERVAWFDVLLDRTDMVSAEDKRRLEAKMEEFGSLVEQSRLFRRKLEEGISKGLAEAIPKAVAEAKAKLEAEEKREGAVEALQQALVEVVQERFPPLTELAQQAVGEVKEPVQLHRLLKQVAVVPDENSARWLLRAFAA